MITTQLKAQYGDHRVVYYSTPDDGNRVHVKNALTGRSGDVSRVWWSAEMKHRSAEDTAKMVLRSEVSTIRALVVETAG